MSLGWTSKTLECNLDPALQGVAARSLLQMCISVLIPMDKCDKHQKVIIRELNTARKGGRNWERP